MNGGTILLMKALINTIKRLLIKITGNQKYKHFMETDNLLMSGVSSIMIIQLFMKLERQYNFQIASEDFIPNNLNTIEKIAEIVIQYSKGKK